MERYFLCLFFSAMTACSGRPDWITDIQICKATVSLTSSQPLTKIEHSSLNEYTKIWYTRSTDGKKWIYECKVNGHRVKLRFPGQNWSRFSRVWKVKSKNSIEITEEIDSFLNNRGFHRYELDQNVHRSDFPIEEWPIILYYWADWAEPSVQQLKILNEISQPKFGIRVFSAYYDKVSQEELERIKTHHGTNLPEAPPHVQALSEKPKVLPTTLIYTYDGELRAMLTGKQSIRSLSYFFD